MPIRVAYLLVTGVAVATAMRANLLLDEASYRGALPWFVTAVISGSAGILLGRVIGKWTKSGLVEVPLGD